MTDNENALVPAGGHGSLAHIGSRPGVRSVSFEKHALLLLNKEAGRYLVGLYLGARTINVKKYESPKNPTGATLFEEFSVIETNAPAAGDEKMQRGDTVSIMGGGQLSSDLRKGGVLMKFLKVEFLGKAPGTLKDGTFAPALNKYRILDVDAEMRRMGFGDALDAKVIDAPGDAIEDVPVAEEPPL